MKREEVVKITEKAQCNREKNDLKNGSQEYEKPQARRKYLLKT